MRPQRPYRALRALVATGILVVIVGLWANAQLTGQRMGTLWEVVMLMLVVAAAIAVFGRRTVQTAVEASQELREDNSGGDTDDGDSDARES